MYVNRHRFLYAWRTYGTSGAIGCAIGMDPQIPLGVVDPTPSYWGYRVTPWTPVVYTADEVTNIAVTGLSQTGADWNREMAGGTQTAADSAFGILLTKLDTLRSQVRALAKDPSFTDEREQRVTVEGIRAYPPSAVTFTPSSMGPRPHVRLAVAPTWSGSVTDASTAPRLPIRAVKLGPDAPAIAETSTQWLLIGHGYNLDGLPMQDGPDTWDESVVVVRSHHPYRSR